MIKIPNFNWFVFNHMGPPNCHNTFPKGHDKLLSSQEWINTLYLPVLSLYSFEWD